MSVNLQNALNISHLIMECHLKEGYTVVDGTMGKGRDTLFLRSMVGEKGRVYSFDIQEQALEQTRMLLEKHQCIENVELIHDSHDRVMDYVKEPIQAAMFNLGYLPGGNHNVTTKASTSIQAVQGCMNRLVKGGVITVCIYYGHPEGEEERIQILEFCKTVDPGEYTIAHLDFINQINLPPLLMMIQKN